MDIVVGRHNGRLSIVRPWSVWDLVGLGRKDYCIQRIELFDEEALLSELDYEGIQCLHITLPLTIGRPIARFAGRWSNDLQTGHMYGIGLDGIGTGRVDFVPNADGSVTNITDWRRQMEPPCGSDFGVCAIGESP